MKVAIVGAGVSGLACASTLEKYGIVPDVFEQLTQSGCRAPYHGALLQVVHRPAADPVTELAKRYGIRITPVNSINKIITVGPGTVVAAKGWLGYSFARGAVINSLENELYGKLSATRMHFKTLANYHELAGEYDHVVVATGSSFSAMEGGHWSDIFRSWARGAVVEGSFDPNAMVIWLNKSYAGNGFAYLGPFNAKEASLILIVSDVREEDVETRWRMFLDHEKITYRETQSFLLEHNAGICFPREIQNIMFIGSGGGLLDYTLGFGIYYAIISGVLAAESIHEKSPYEHKIKFLLRRVYQSYLCRMALNNLTNSDYDRLLGVIKTPLVNNLIYHTNIDIIKLLGNVLGIVRPEPKLRGKF